METKFQVYGNKVYGVEVSSYGLKNGYLDYQSLANILGACILNNTIRSSTYSEDWELIYGEDYCGMTEDGDPCSMYDDDCVTMEPVEIYQDYIISVFGADFLGRYTDEIVYYSEELDIYIWGVTHYGTSWDHVLTNIELEGVGE